MKPRNIPYVITSGNTSNFSIRKALHRPAERALGEKNKVERADGTSAIDNLLGMAILRRSDFQIVSQIPVDTCIEEVGNALECRIHVRPGQGRQFVAGLEVCDE